MPEPIQAVLFDLYGTLVDIHTDEANPAIYHTLAQFLNYYQVYFRPADLARLYREKSEKLLAECPGPYGEIDVFRVFEEILAEGRGQRPDRALVIWVARLFRSLSRGHLRLFPDTVPTLEKLRPEYRLGIVSDAQWVYSEPEIRMLGLNAYFDTIILSSRYCVRKPDPQIFAHALKAMHLEAAQAVYVGDNPAVDLGGPQAIGMAVLLIQRHETGPDFPVPVLHDLNQLLPYLESQTTD